MAISLIPNADGWRPELVQELTGTVLEIGVGSGANLPYYRQATQVWAIEPDPTLAQEAAQKALRAHVPVTVKLAPAEALPFDADMFDYVVSSLVFCSVAEPRAALGELRRVLKPGGVLHMVEHVRPDNVLLAAFFSAVTPYWSRLAHNCHLDRPTVELLRAEGWQVEVRRRWMVFVRLRAVVDR